MTDFVSSGTQNILSIDSKFKARKCSFGRVVLTSLFRWRCCRHRATWAWIKAADNRRLSWQLSRWAVRQNPTRLQRVWSASVSIRPSGERWIAGRNDFACYKLRTLACRQQKHNYTFFVDTCIISERLCYRPSVCRLSVVCALLRPLKFSAIFLRHLVPWPSVDIRGNFTEIVPGEPICRGVKHKTGSQI